MMDKKQKLNHKQNLKSFRLMMTVFIVCYLIAPFIFWKDVSQLNWTGWTIFLTLYVITFGSVFLFYLHRYKKLKRYLSK
jgi:O-antigen/teichoic acid export membrane protein